MRVIAYTEIAAPRQIVWRYVADPDRCRDFMDGITRWESEGTGTGLGARYLIRMRVGSADVGGLIEIVEFDPPSELAWSSVTGVDHRGRWRLRPSDHGRRTQLELRVTYHAAGGVMALLADILAFPVVRGHLQRSLAALKLQVETRRRAPVRRGHSGRARKR